MGLQLIKTVDFSDAVEGFPMQEIAAQQLKKVFMKVTHDSHNIGFQSDVFRTYVLFCVVRSPTTPNVLEALEVRNSVPCHGRKRNSLNETTVEPEI